MMKQQVCFCGYNLCNLFEKNKIIALQILFQLVNKFQRTYFKRLKQKLHLLGTAEYNFSIKSRDEISLD